MSVWRRNSHRQPPLSRRGSGRRFIHRENGAAASGLAAVLDLGTSRVSCWIGDAAGVLGCGEVSSEGVRAGEIADVRAASRCVRAAVEEAERQSGLLVQGVCAAVSGASVEGWVSGGAVPILNETQEIGARDVAWALSLAETQVRFRTASSHLRTATSIAPGRSAEGARLHVFPRRYWVDGRGPVRDPVGLSGALLQAEVVVVGASAFALENLSRVVRMAGVRLQGAVAGPVASGFGALSEEERELGALVIDIGAGTTSYSVWTGGTLGACGCICLGGERVTLDIAAGLGISRESAEGLKRALKPGPADECLLASSLGGLGPRSFARRELAEIVEARVEEIMRLVLARMGAFDLRELGAGVVLAGGAARGEETLSVARAVFGVNARPARMGAAELPGPENAVAAGLLALSTAGAGNPAPDGLGGVHVRRSTLKRAWEWLAAGF